MSLNSMLSQSEHYSSRKKQSYQTFSGDLIEFRIDPKRMHTSPIVSVNNKALESDMRKWPFASGDIINSDGDGFIKFAAPRSKSVFSIDYRKLKSAYHQIKKTG